MPGPISQYFIAFVIILTLAGGCNFSPDTSKPVYNIEITTEKEVYTLPPTEGVPDTVRYRAVNLSDVSVYYLSPWGFVTLEKKKNGDWSNLGPWYYWIMIGPSIKEFEPGDTLHTIELLLTHEIIEGSGYYRFLFDFYDDTDIQSTLPLGQRISNTFEIRKPD